MATGTYVNVPVCAGNWKICLAYQAAHVDLLENRKVDLKSPLDSLETDLRANYREVTHNGASGVQNVSVSVTGQKYSRTYWH